MATTNNSGNSSNAINARVPDVRLEQMAIASIFYEVGLIIGLDMSRIKDVVRIAPNNPYVALQVCPEKFIGFGDMQGSEDRLTRVSFSSMFDTDLLNKELESMSGTYIGLLEFRTLFSKCARFPEAIVAIDVAILKWIAKLDLDDRKRLVTDSDIVKPLCYLSAYPNISEACKDDIIRVLEIFSEFFEKDVTFYSTLLLNLLKFINSVEIQKKVKELALGLCRSNSFRYFSEYYLILGNSKKYPEALEGNLWEVNNFFLNDVPECYFKFYSKDSSFCLPLIRFGLVTDMSQHFCSIARIGDDGVLVWEKDSYKWIDINLEKSSFSASSLFVVYHIHPPVSFWIKIKSCINMKEFNELLEKPEMKFMTLTYNITIMESNIEFSVTSPSKN